MTNAEASAAIHLDGISRHYGGVTALTTMNLTVPRGQRLGVIGPNGAGKSTLFKVIAGDTSPSAGKVYIMGRNVTDVSVHKRAQIGIGRTYQITNLFLSLTVRESLTVAARRSGPKSQAREVVEGIAAQFGLDQAMDTTVGTLSYGEQRMCELALALSGPTEVLLLDEPAAGLGAADREVMVAALDSLPKSLTVLLVEHDIDLTLGLVERVICLSNGELVADEASGAVKESTEIQRVYLGQSP